MHPLTKSVPEQRLDICSKCLKRQEGANGSHQSPKNDNETSTIEEDNDFYYEKIRFLIVDCRLDTL